MNTINIIHKTPGYSAESEPTAPLLNHRLLVDQHVCPSSCSHFINNIYGAKNNLVTTGDS